MEELRTLDVGYGYTADDGLSYPFRGTGIGLLPSLDDVLSSFPTQAFLIHVRDGGAENRVHPRRKVRPDVPPSVFPGSRCTATRQRFGFSVNAGLR
jgi:hypothetical protein